MPHRAVRSGSELIARSIDVRTTLDETLGNVIGYVSEFKSAADLRVAGQRVDASTATFSGGAPADLRNTVYLLVQGTVTNGVLRARRIEFLPN